MYIIAKIVMYVCLDGIIIVHGLANVSDKAMSAVSTPSLSQLSYILSLL